MNQTEKNPTNMDPKSDSSVVRGIIYALRFSVVGFLIPYALAATIALVNYLFTQSMSDLQLELRMKLTHYFIAAVGCGVLFGLAAILNFTPPNRLGVVRSLLLVGCSAIAGCFAAILLTAIYDPIPRYLTIEDPVVWFQLLIAIATPTTYTALHTFLRCRNQKT